MSTRHILLGLLASGPGPGYDLQRRHDERFPQARQLPYGQGDTSLLRLVRRGLAEVAGTETDGRPRRSAYRTTEKGARELAQWAAQIAPPAPFVTNEIFAKVVVSILSGGDPAAYLRAQRAAHMERMRELTAVKTAPGADLSTVLSADFAL